MKLIIGDEIVEQRRLLPWAELHHHNPDIWIAEIAQSILEWLNEEENITITTSGSTGQPKPIRLTKIAMVHSAQLTIDYFQLGEGQNALLCLPAQFIAGKMMIVRAFVANLNLYCVRPSATPLLELTEQMDFVAMTPYQVSKSLNEDYKGFSDVEQVIIGGAPVSTMLKEQLQDVPARCYQTYGMTETITHIALQQLNGLKNKMYLKHYPTFILRIEMVVL